MKALVTGGSGFLGSHLCEYLLKNGYQVISLDNLYTGYKKNIAHLLNNPNFNFIIGDVTKKTIFEVNEIYHLACPASPIHYQKNPVKTIRTCIEGTLNMLEICLEVGAKLFIASTSEIYGDPLVHPQIETYWGNVNPIGPRACFSPDTEILTKSGWKWTWMIGKNDKIATLNHQQLEYQYPENIIKEKYNGKMISFSNSQCDLIVTPNHKMYVNNCLMQANSCEGKMLKTIPNYKGTKKEFFNNLKMNDWLEFFGYYISAGKCEKSLIKIKNIQKIHECINKLQFQYLENNEYIIINDERLYSYLNKEKHIPREFLSLSKEQLIILFNAIMLGNNTFYSSSWQLMSDMQELLLKIGKSGNVSPIESTYELSITSDQPEYPEKNVIDYDGYVYCVTVPNRIIFVRRNGKTLWCGNCYDEGKRCAEALTVSYSRQYNIQTRIARIFNTYGPKMHPNDGRVISNFIMQAIKNEPITIYGNGNQTRSFCFVNDLIQGIIKLMNSNISEPVNLGNPNEFTIENLAKKIIHLTNSKSLIIHEPLPQDDPVRRKPDITKAKLLDWEPKIQLNEGLKKTIDYFNCKFAN